MKKVFLVIDEPKGCAECPVCASYAESAFSIREYWCTPMDNREAPPEYRPNWCPLKPLPIEKHLPDDLTDDYGWGHTDGWNDCIEEIVGQE